MAINNLNLVQVRGDIVKKPLITRNENSIIISHNGKKLIQELDKYADMTDEEIIEQFTKVRNIKNNRV